VAALKNGNLTQYAADMKTVGQLITQAESDLKKAAKTGTKSVKASVALGAPRMATSTPRSGGKGL